MNTSNECPCSRLTTYLTMLGRTFTVNYLSFLLMRVTGIALTVYLFLHIYSIGKIQNGVEVFDLKMESYNTPIGWVMEYLLLLAVIYHMFNGIRVTVADFFGLTKRQSEMTWLVGVCVIGIAAASVPVFLGRIIR